jgi:hypothetical protein
MQKERIQNRNNSVTFSMQDDNFVEVQVSILALLIHHSDVNVSLSRRHILL